MQGHGFFVSCSADLMQVQGMAFYYAAMFGATNRLEDASHAYRREWLALMLPSTRRTMPKITPQRAQAALFVCQD